MKIVYHMFLYFICEAQSEENARKSKNPLPYFRRHVKDVTEGTITQTTDELHSNLVSFLIKNIKEIYNELEESDHTEFSYSKRVSTVVDTPTISVDTTFYAMSSDNKSNEFADTIIVNRDSSIDRNFSLLDTDVVSFVTDIPTDITEVNIGSIDTTDDEDILQKYRNATLVPFSNKEIIDMDSSTTAYGLTETEELLYPAKNYLLFKIDRKERGTILQLLDTNISNASRREEFTLAEKPRSCIYCNNVASENCNDPKYRLIPSTTCERVDDLCYSLHTPFGVIDRGCFNLNHNLTTYVCSCNLCNYISITEMPYIFSKKRDWIDNVAELSRMRQLKKSVLKEMSCLKCETNLTAVTGNKLNDINCLEGNIASLPTESCEYNEVCAVRAIRKYGYVWRGCVKFPLYNYWWNLCDNDLCNYDTVVSIHDLG